MTSAISIDPRVRNAMSWVGTSEGGDLALFLRYCAFLERRLQDPEHRPEKDVDALWHFHILDMENYADFCRDRFGRPVLHRIGAKGERLEGADCGPGNS